jgi:signal transduction histidine kinase
LSNAVKFTPEGGTVTVTGREAGGMLEVIVKDSGMGIDPAFLPRVFDRFRQADGRSTRSARGLGLGLSIVKDLVTAHGGSVQVDSEGAGRGTTVTVRLPLYQMSPTVKPSGNGS